jgi:hypothetical protein
MYVIIYIVIYAYASILVYLSYTNYTASISGSGWSVYFSEGVTPSSSLIPGIVEDFHRYAPDPTRSYHGRRG